MSTSEIFNYRQVNDQLITAGQPTEEQLKAAADEGFTTVIIYSSETYELAIFPDGNFIGKPEDAFAASAMYLQ